MNDHTVPLPRRSSRVWAITLRVILTVVALLSLGILAWVPMLRLALLRRRPLDWTLFAVVLVLSIGSTVCLDYLDGRSGWQANAAGITLLLVSFGTAAYFPVADKGSRGPAVTHLAGPSAVPRIPMYPTAYPHSQMHPPQPLNLPQPLNPPQSPVDQAPTLGTPVDPAHGSAPAPERIEQVRSELGELSDYLRNKDVW